MTPAKKTSGRKKTPAARKKTTAKRASAKKASKRATAKKTAKRATAKRTTRKTAKKTTAKRTAKRTTAKKTAKKTTKKVTARKTTAKGSAKKTSRKRPGGKSTVRKPSTRKTRSEKAGARGAVAKKSAPRKPPKTRGDLGRTAGKTRGDRGRTGEKVAGAKTTRPRARAVKFDKKQLAEIRRQLEGERGNLVAQLEELTADSFDGTQSDMTGEVGLDDDFADAGSATFERERDLSIQNNVRDLIDQMNRAIQRIEDGNYGTCERCGNPIEAARLKALPHALLCMDCKRREERAR
jgi:RNA polymerase-binding protein DksA